MKCTELLAGNFLAECLGDRCDGHQTRGNGVEFGL
jgi:hypothetical protein